MNYNVLAYVRDEQPTAEPGTIVGVIIRGTDDLGMTMEGGVAQAIDELARHIPRYDGPEPAPRVTIDVFPAHLNVQSTQEEE